MSQDHDTHFHTRPEEAQDTLDELAASKVVDLQESTDDIESLKQTLSETKDQLLRALAEAENVRRRSIKERDEASKYAMTQFAREILSVEDNLIRALGIMKTDAVVQNEDVQQFVTGIEMTARELASTLAKFHVVALNPEGEKFEPEWHQAMFEVENTVHPAGVVVQVLQVGYKIHDRLLRPALVSVAKGEPKTEATHVEV